MKFIKTLLFVFVFLLFPKLVLADGLDGLNILFERMMYALGILILFGYFLQIRNLFVESEGLNFFSNAFCIALFLFGIIAGGGKELGIYILPAVISLLLVLIKRLLRRSSSQSDVE